MIQMVEFQVGRPDKIINKGKKKKIPFSENPFEGMEYNFLKNRKSHYLCNN